MPPSAIQIQPADRTDDFRNRNRAEPRLLSTENGLSHRERDQRFRDLRTRVLAALVNSGYAALAFIGCDVDHGRVVLHGCVPSYHLKQLAQVYAQRVEGVSRVDNRVEVLGPAPV
jgi:osmotically-inducible protein OsmY